MRVIPRRDRQSGGCRSDSPSCDVNASDDRRQADNFRVRALSKLGYLQIRPGSIELSGEVHQSMGNFNRCIGEISNWFVVPSGLAGAAAIRVAAPSSIKARRDVPSHQSPGKASSAMSS